MDCSPSGNSVHGILQARMLEWVSISFSRGPSRPRNQTLVSCIAGRFFTNWARSAPSSPCPILKTGIPLASCRWREQGRPWGGRQTGEVSLHTPALSFAVPTWVGKNLWRRAWQPIPVFLPGEFCGQNSLVGCSPWSRKESDTTEQLTHTHTHTHTPVLGQCQAWDHERSRWALCCLDSLSQPVYTCCCSLPFSETISCREGFSVLRGDTPDDPHIPGEPIRVAVWPDVCGSDSRQGCSFSPTPATLSVLGKLQTSFLPPFSLQSIENDNVCPAFIESSCEKQMWSSL